MKKTIIYLVASFVVLMFTLPAYAEIEWSGNISAGVQNVEGDDPDTEENLEFTEAPLNLDLKADVADGVTANAEIRTYWDLVWVKDAYLDLTNLIPDASLLVGKIIFPLGKEGETLTDGADMMKNALIGNSVFTEIGSYLGQFALTDEEEATLENMNLTGEVVDYGIALKKTMGAVNCLLAVTNGNYYDIGADNNSDKAIGLNLSGDVPGVEGLSLGASYVTNDAAGEDETNESTDLVLDAGYKVGATNIGVTYASGELEYGPTGDEYKLEADGLGAELSYAVTDDCSVALRYGKVDLSGDGEDFAELTKMQIGLTNKLADNAVFKVEYVDNACKEEGEDIKTDDDYDGIKAAVAVAF